ncbi:MAG: hypothetical protein ACRC1T_04230 [Clostridium chrysemydis]|nr:hypothetical protein [Clostridium sp. LY3-2]MCR6514575.1 hypothetical protein [Clostridium sp. LY3-2]
MSNHGDRKFNQDARKTGKEKVAEMRREEEKMESKIKAKEKVEGVIAHH